MVSSAYPRLLIFLPAILIPFISFPSLITVDKTSKTMLNSSGESGHSCLVPDFRGHAFSVSVDNV